MHRRGTVEVADIRMNREFNPSLMTQHRNHPKPCTLPDLDGSPPGTNVANSSHKNVDKALEPAKRIVSGFPPS
jgi:hypothetical protein